MNSDQRSAMDVLSTRHSCRKFTSEPVTRAELEQIVSAGRLAATARNVQPWHFVAVTDPAKRCELGGLTDYGKFIAETPACIVVLCEDTKYYLEDGCAAVQNILLAAEALGLSSCWVAGDKKPYAGQIVKAVGAPADMKLIALVAIGHEAEKSQRATKKTLDQVLHWDRF
jgi:nitroreductase